MFEDMGQMYIAMLVTLAVIALITTLVKVRKNNDAKELVELLINSRITVAEIMNEVQKMKELDKLKGKQAVEDYVVDELKKLVDTNTSLMPQEKELIKNNIRTIAKYFIKKDNKNI